MKTHLMSAHDLQTMRRAQRLLQSGQLVAFPTDTVYGIGAHAFRPEAVAALYTAKKRPITKAIPILVAGVEDVALVARMVPAVAWKLIEQFWPGGLTIVLPRAEQVPPVVTAGGETVAIRCPDHPIPLNLMNVTGAPLAATSANLSGQASPTTARQVMRHLTGRVPLVIDGGACPDGVPSTVVDLSTSPARLLRVGAISAQALRELLPDLT